MKVTVMPIAIGTIPKGLKKRLRELEIKEQENSIETTEQSPGDLRRFAVSQTQLKSHHLTVVCNSPKKVK